MTTSSMQTSLQATLAICAGGAARRRRRKRTGLVAAGLAGLFASTLEGLRSFAASLGGTSAAV